VRCEWELEVGGGDEELQRDERLWRLSAWGTGPYLSTPSCLSGLVNRIDSWFAASDFLLVHQDCCFGHSVEIVTHAPRFMMLSVTTIFCKSTHHLLLLLLLLLLLQQINRFSCQPIRQDIYLSTPNATIIRTPIFIDSSGMWLVWI
jgi:hypothetical protein